MVKMRYNDFSTTRLMFFHLLTLWKMALGGEEMPQSGKCFSCKQEDLNLSSKTRTLLQQSGN